MQKIPKKISERFIREINKYQKILNTAKDRDVHESDTVTIITDMLADVFGFDKYTEITSEHAIRGTFCDLAIKSDNKIEYLIEVKAIGLNLKENHLRQVIAYGVTQGVQWVVLTNGVVWEIYKIKFDKPIKYDKVFSFNMLDLNPRKQDDQHKLFLLCKEGVAKAAIEDFHDHVKTVNRFTLGAIIRSDSVISIIRREMRKMSAGIKVTDKEIERILSAEVLKRDIVYGESADNALKQLKKQLKKQTKKQTKTKLNIENKMVLNPL